VQENQTSSQGLRNSVVFCKYSFRALFRLSMSNSCVENILTGSYLLAQCYILTSEQQEEEITLLQLLSAANSHSA
jgi:hypothetical protein